MENDKIVIVGTVMSPPIYTLGDQCYSFKLVSQSTRGNSSVCSLHYISTKEKLSESNVQDYIYVFVKKGSKVEVKGKRYGSNAFYIVAEKIRVIE